MFIRHLTTQVHATVAHNSLLKKIFSKALPSVLSLGLIVGCQTTTPDNTSVIPPTTESLLIGGYTQDTNEGIYHLTFDGKSLVNNGLVVKETNPSYLAINKAKNKIYAAIGDSSGGIAEYHWDNNQKALTLIDKITGLGQGACHIALNNTEDKAAIANYGSGEIFLFDTHANNAEKSLSLIGEFKNTGHSITSRQEAPHMHFVHWDNSGQYLYAVDLGTDEVLVIDTKQSINPDKKLSPKVAAKLPAGDGPRHLVFHPSQPLVYVLNELSNTVASYKQNSEDGTLTLFQHIDALQTPSNITNQASAIKISDDGKFIYAAIRGVNQITVFEVTNDGSLAFIQTHATLGDWPRDITLSAQQDHLFIANRRTNTITVLKRDIATGLLSPTHIRLDISTPSFIGLF